MQTSFTNQTKPNQMEPTYPTRKKSNDDTQQDVFQVRQHSNMKFPILISEHNEALRHHGLTQTKLNPLQKNSKLIATVIQVSVFNKIKKKKKTLN